MATNPKFRVPPHLDPIDRALVDVALNVTGYRAEDDVTGHGPRLMIFEPPRHGKSWLCSRYLPGWFLGMWPDRRITIASYAQTLALDRGFEARNDIQTYGGHAFGVHMDQRRKAASQWAIQTHAGEFRAVGVGSGLTGTGADILVIDDPFKDAKEAQSDVIRENVWQWFLSTASTRLMPGGAIVLVMTRWHDDDLAGRLLREDPTRDKFGRLLAEGVERRVEAEGDVWDVICLPAIAEDWESHPMMDGPDLLDREPGEALWPERFPIVRLEHERGKFGTYWFGALYQQRPTPDEGGMFQRSKFRYFSWIDKERGLLEYWRGEDGTEPALIDLRHCGLFGTCDVAATEKTYSDYTVLAIWAVTHTRDLLLLDVFREQIDTTKQQGWVLQCWAQWTAVPWIGVENATHGLGLIQGLRKLGHAVKKLKPDRDKVARASVAGTLMENGQVYFPAAHDLLEDWERELLTFPNATHDDMVDVLGYAAIQLPKIDVGMPMSGGTPVTFGVGT